jgi:putative PIN family toxin of toxin-antitoxin system
VSEGGLPGVVFDCVVYLQAVAGPSGPAARLLGLLEAGRFTLYVSDHVLAEVREVLERPRVRAKNPAVTDETTRELLDRLARIATKVADVPSLFSLPRDPDDEPYVNLALAADADYLVTRDRDLLDLMNDPGFRASHPRLIILNPVALLQVLTPTP